ncbi:ATP-dependent DNA helicase RecG [Levilactobacillus brevis]|uniref:ATP-dependent DNA helicase RecG n=1 Tax=Levilactobacillus brevis TaxID=1580 RepID=UPI000580361D|nr:ATP-dependent DNA helicase RecG [Levilactobacillus brevis]KID44963.1 ATP-dependent DNA helicase RecG [Levilactobacillus brevis]MBS0977751.1 ATP-dependent DNA helicase RecG [Levilactobacillus brevis]MCU0199592.1 ATP-dependent DNA helicase RecG [Levilactobacillus brevis]ODP95104.1 ATP-dependent DNA helicase RecG [Levilactobacillus brevis]ORJ54487.1 DNA helicase RecG [Levilactobacillus brevis]
MASLSDAVSQLAGVGPKRVQALQSLGIENMNDLLTYFPFRYEDLQAKDPAELTDQAKVTLKGTVAGAPVLTRFGRKKNRLNFRLLVDEHTAMPVTFFNQPWLKDQLEVGNEIVVYGRFDAKRQSLAGMKILASADSGMGSIYPANKEIRQGTVKKLVAEAYEQYAPVIVDLIPETLREHYRLLHRREMIHDMHFPADETAAQAARRTAKFEEFYLFELRLQIVKLQDHTLHGQPLAYDLSKLKAFIASLPYELTAAQKRVVNEICFDLKRPIHMNRLLQGDVGSGKTVVAAIAMYAAITAGAQAALMAPTEILAEQHANNLAKLFADFPVNVALLTGATKAAARKTLLPQIAQGGVDLLIGTHALIQPEVTYHQLGLAVIDEQHRFGVNQRQALREKGQQPDVLAMTATPIPRTLAITAYGEMDVSVINELPAGRQPIKTTWIRSNQVDATLRQVKAELSTGSQAYVVTPLIEESEAVDMKNAEAIYERFKTEFEPTYKVGLLHGRMKDDEKNAIMAAFKANEFQVLVATTVIEVGVDVPNATLMMIYDADHFGLAQLHQLRGRVGRGTRASACILIADPKNQLAIERMTTMTSTNDGFVLSQKDLELRGPGDILGRKQSGVPDFKVGDPVADLNILSVAQQAAKETVAAPNWAEKDANLALAAFLSTTAHQTTTMD